MRTLPQQPSLEYLKQQAKELLDAMRETQPSASLSDAQRALAQQYGYRAWTDLKAAVEALRAAGNEADPELASAIAKTFDLGQLTKPATVSYELMGPEIRMETEAGRWFARAVFDYISEEAAADSVRLMEAAAAAGIQAPRALRSIEGNLIAEVGEHHWRVDEWFEYGPSIPKPASKENARKVGELLGALHNLKVPASGEVSGWLSQRRPTERWYEILGIIEEKDVPWAGAFKETFPAILELSSVATEPAADEPILSHVDLGMGSVRAGRDGSLVPVAWDFASATPPSWELGYVLHSWTESVDGALNEAVPKPLFDGYASVTGARPALDLSFFASAINAWLNWFVSRINAALHEDGHGTTELLYMLDHPLTPVTLERIISAAR